MRRYEVALSAGNRAIIDALNLGDLEQKLNASGMRWTNIHPYVSLMRAECPSSPSEKGCAWEPD